MRRIIALLSGAFIITLCSFHADAQSLEEIAKIAQERAKELQKVEQPRYNQILDSKNLADYEKFIHDYPCGRYTSEIERRAEEIRTWNKAKASNTVKAYENYLARTKYHWYDNEATYAIRGLKQASEKRNWNKVIAINTIQAYQEYLDKHPSSGYRIEAENAINKLHGASVWENIKETNRIEELQRFIDSYPNATEEISVAALRLHELKGCQYYNDNDLNSAYSEFIQLSREKVSYANLAIYDEVIEYGEFSKLETCSSEAELFGFMKRYPDSKYSTQVYNLIATAKARNLRDDASSNDYMEALSYAQDSSTKSLVQSLIKQNKASKRERNGGTVNLGLNFMDVGYNGVSTDGTIWYYDIGLLLRIGNYRDKVQFAFGFKPGFIHYDYDSDGFHLPAVGLLKLNLCNISQNSRFFVYGQYQYNAVRIQHVESDMSWCVGFGLAWKHFDWSFYYRQDAGNFKSLTYNKQHYFGISLVRYWQL